MSDIPAEVVISSHLGNLPYTIKPDRFSSHALIATLIKQHTHQVQDEPYVILDVGCAYGFLRPYLPSPRFYLIGVDIHEQAVEQARMSYDEVYLANIGDALEVPLRRPLHTMVFGDILEHLADPLTVLRTLLRTYASSGTQVIISVPNIAHLYIRLNLLAGRFDYADRGILDRTHLRFFTLSTAKRLINDSGLKLKSVRATAVPLPLLHPAFQEGQPLFPIHAISSRLANIFKSLLAYQFVLEAVYASRG